MTGNTSRPPGGFPELHIFRPGQLTGPRLENRPGERAAIFVTRFVNPEWLVEIEIDAVVAGGSYD